MLPRSTHRWSPAAALLLAAALCACVVPRPSHAQSDCTVAQAWSSSCPQDTNTYYFCLAGNATGGCQPSANGAWPSSLCSSQCSFNSGNAAYTPPPCSTPETACPVGYYQCLVGPTPQCRSNLQPGFVPSCSQQCQVGSGTLPPPPPLMPPTPQPSPPPPPPSPPSPPPPAPPPSPPSPSPPSPLRPLVFCPPVPDGWLGWTLYGNMQYIPGQSGPARFVQCSTSPYPTISMIAMLHEMELINFLSSNMHLGFSLTQLYAADGTPNKVLLCEWTDTEIPGTMIYDLTYQSCLYQCTAPSCTSPQRR